MCTIKGNGHFFFDDFLFGPAESSGVSHSHALEQELILSGNCIRHVRQEVRKWAVFKTGWLMIQGLYMITLFTEDYFIISYYFIIQERGIPNKTKLFTEWPAGLDHLKAWGFHGSGRPPEAPGLVLQRASGPWVFQGPLCVGAAVTQLRQDNARHLKTILSLPGDVYGELWICKSIQPWLLAPNTCGRGHCPPGDFFLEQITASISEPYAFESGLSVVKHPGHQPPGLRST